MINVELIRLGTNSTGGTLGILKIDKIPFCCTMEPPDRGNEANKSSIPTGQYMCRTYSSAKYKNVFQVIDVSGRTIVLFHAGNTALHTKGCILLGASFGKLEGNWAVLNSGNTFNRFRDIIEDNIFHLTITEVY